MRGPVGSFAANGYGLHDMAGNVWEWCWDNYASGYSAESQIDPRGPNTGSTRVVRGGSWTGSMSAKDCRVANRADSDPAISEYNNVGFRVVRGSAP